MRYTLIAPWIDGFDDVTLNFEQLQTALTTPAWSAPTLLNSWANYGSGFETAGYLKDGLGFVHLKGVVTGGANATTVFVLPAGYRPGAISNLPSNNAGVAGNVQIDSGGNVKSYFSAGTGTTALSGFTFLAEN